MRRRRRFVLGALLVALAVPVRPDAADAHSVLASSQPNPGQRLSAAPGVAVLRFTEPLNRPLSRAMVLDPTGQRFVGTASGDDEIRVPLSTNARGIYRVDWSTVSTLDGHTWRGSFEFGVGVSPATGSEGSGVSPRVDDLWLSIGRWVEALALLLALGMLLLRRLARGQDGLDWVRPRLAAVLAVALVAGIAVVGGEAWTAAGSVSPSAFGAYLTTGLPGLARLVRLGLEVLALVAAARRVPRVWLFVAGATIAVAASGHGAAVRPTWWGVTANAIHLLAAGVWAGGILALATLRPPGGWRSDAGRRLLVRFSPAALTGFALTVAFGVIEAAQQLGTVSELVGSSYGKVLLAKILVVAGMVPLSVVAWRRRRPHPRGEAMLAVAAVAAAAVLAAFPLPPGRLVEREAPERAGSSIAAIARGSDLTMGDQAGQVLVGLTIRPAVPGTNKVLVYLLPLEGEKAAATLSAHLIVRGGSIPLSTCGETCRMASATLRGNERLSVRVAGTKGGVASFDLPSLPARDGATILGRAQERMHRLRTYRLFETLSSGLATIPARYEFHAPDRMRSSVNRSQAVWIGDTRYRRDSPAERWEVDGAGPAIPVPSFIWDSFKPFTDPRIIGAQRVDGRKTTIVSFSGGDRQDMAIWFRLWVDPAGLVQRAEMRAIGHFMDDRYYDFDAPFTISAPTG